MSSNETLPTISTTAGTYFSYTIPGMDISTGPMLFTLVSRFMGVITPDELPLAQVRQLLHSNLTVIEFATNAIKVESGFIALMSIFMILAVVPLLATCCWCCCRRNPEEDAEFVRRAASTTMIDESLEQSLQCRKSASVTTLWLVFILLSLSDLCIFYANSRLATTIEMTPEMIKSTVHDMEVFLKDTHLQIKHKLDNGFHVSVEKVVKDLEDVDVLLGEPIQAEISAHTGLELAYDSLATLSLANAELIYRVLMLQETVGRALKLSQEAAARMEELQIQLSVLQRQCTYRDRPLCDTLRIRSFEENGIIDALKTLQEDQTIFRMRYLGEIEMGATVRNLTSEVGMSRSIFSNFPQQVKLDTAYERNYTLEQLESIRHRTTANAQMLTATINVLLHRLEGVWNTIKPHYDKLQEWSDIYWTTGWVAGMVIVWILLFMLMSYCCLLCESNVKAGVILFIAILIICLSSVCITSYGLLSLAIGGNAEVFLCKPMYDAGVSAAQRMDMTTGLTVRGDWNGYNAMVNYDVLGKLFDKPGYVYETEPQMGIIGELLRPDGVNRAIVNVSLATALSGCELNEPSYNVFQLDAFVNTTAISNLKQFPKVTQAIDSIDVSERTLLSLTQTIQNILESMLQTSSFNLTTYRATIGSPTPEKDLATFIDQMQRVALQIQDVATSSRMTTLGSRSKRLQASILQPLEQLQNEILYHLTALELQRDPWAKQVNQTLNHLRNIQEYLEKTAGEICDNQTRIYTERLKTYLTNSKATMSSQLGDTTAKCRPFFDIFDANRIFLCRNMVDYINALWFCSFLILLLWSIGTPVGLNLISLQRKLTNLKKAKLRVADERGRRRDRGTISSPRDRSPSNAARRKPAPLRRSATEETLDIEIEPQYRPSSEREQRSRSREVSQSPQHSRGQVQSLLKSLRRRPDSYADDNWRSPSASRGTSRERGPYERERGPYERDRSQARAPSRTSGQTKPQLQRQGTQELILDEEEAYTSSGQASRSEPRREEGMVKSMARNILSGPKPPMRRLGTQDFDIDAEEIRQSPKRSAGISRSEPRRNDRRQDAYARPSDKPQIRRQGTEELSLDGEEAWQSPQQRQQQSSAGRGRSEPRRGDGRGRESDSRSTSAGQVRSRRSVTPVLPARPDAQPAYPQPRTPSRLRSRVSLTTRAVEKIAKSRPSAAKTLNRRDTEDFDIDEDEQYGTTGRSMQAVEAARRTPPRSAPPPPPPPSNRFSDTRSVRWNAAEDDVVFEDCD